MNRRLLPVLLAALGVVAAVHFRADAKAQARAPQAPGTRPPANADRAYPDRPKAAQEVLDRGRAQYGVSCAFCHGSDAGGGEVGPNLWRSNVVLEDQAGELIAPIVHGARVDKGMPRIDLTDAQIAEIAAWLHSLHVTSHLAADESINIVTGNAAAGRVAFERRCGSCHSVTGDLQGFAARVPTPKSLQQSWLLPGSVARVAGLHVPPVTATVTLPTGESVSGKLVRIDDFYVGLREDDGTTLGFERTGDVPKVEIHDPLEPHRKLIPLYTDKEIHDITAYLVTLK